MLTNISKAWEKLLAIPIVFLGVGVYRGWLRIVFGMGTFPTFTPNDYIVFEAAIGVISLVLALNFRKFVPLWECIWMRRLTIGIFIASTAAMVVLTQVPSWEVPYVVFGVNVVHGIIMALMGCALGVLILLWAEFFGSLAPTQVALYHATSLLFGEGISIVCAGMNHTYLLAVSVILPVVSVRMVVRSMKKVPVKDRPGKDTHIDISFPWKPIILMTICTFATAFAYIPITSPRIANYLGVISVSLFVIVGILLATKWFNFAIVYQFGLPLLIAGLLVVVSTSQEATSITVFCMDASYAALSILLMVILSNITYRFGVSAVLISGVERGLRYLFQAGGWSLKSALALFLTPQAQLVAHVSVAAIVAVTFILIFFSERELNAKWGISLNPHNVGDGENRGSLSIKSNQAADFYGLTPREEEILQLLVRGESVSDMEGQLYIARGTLKAHINHIYKKFDVHSRSELEEKVRIL